MKNCLILGILFVAPALGANCGGVTACVCGDSITSNYTMSGNLTCTYSQNGAAGLTMPTNNVIFDMAGFTIDGNNSNGGAQPIIPYGSNTTVQPKLSNTGLTINGSGITVTSTSSGAVIKGFKIGVSTGGGSNLTLTLTNILIQSPGLTGLSVSGGIGHVITNPTIDGALGYSLKMNGGGAITGGSITHSKSDVQVTQGCAVTVTSASAVTITSLSITDSMSYAICQSVNTVTWSGITLARSKKGVFQDDANGYSGWDTASTSDGAPLRVYVATSGQTYDYAGATIGAIYCGGGCASNIWKSAVLLGPLVSTSCTSCTVQGITATSISSGALAGEITLTGAGATVTGNTIANCLSAFGISATAASVTISSNTISHCQTATSLGSTGTVSSNTFRFNRTNGLFSTGLTLTNNISAFESDLWSGLSDGTFPKPVAFTDTRSSSSVGVPISFSFDLNTFAGAACPTCTWTAATYPTETVSASLTGNTVSGTFTPSRAGTYSLLVTRADSGGNTWKRNYIYLVGSIASTATQYFLLEGESPRVTNGAGMDAMPSSTTNAGTLAYAYCSGWWQLSPIEYPLYPLAYLTGVTASLYYTNQASGGLPPQFMWERNARYENDNNLNGLGPVALVLYSQANDTAKNVFATGTAAFTPNTVMDSPNSWNSLGIYLAGDADALTSFPVLISNFGGNISSYTTTASHATATPVRSVSSADVPVLSATSLGVVVDNSTGSAASQTLAIGGFYANSRYSVRVDGAEQSQTTTASDGYGSFTVSIPVGVHTVSLALIVPGRFLV